MIHLLFLCLPFGAFAMAGDLSSPSLAFPASFPVEARTNILAALTHPAYQFAGGEFVNTSTTLRYGGDTKALNLFLQRLSKCRDAIVSITFVTFIEDADVTWRVSHLAHDEGWLHVQINLSSKHIKLDELAIPEIRGH